jgi:SAM-dependent methyltransferase
VEEAKLGKSDWASASGDIWARRWRDTDLALAALSLPLRSAIVDRAPAAEFEAFEIGCGPGSTTIEVADSCPRAAILACDISPSLAAIAQERAVGHGRIRVVVGDAEQVASEQGPFDLLFSRHGVMFFGDPVRAFGALRRAANPGAAFVFSCFQAWDSNPWASELANAAANRIQPAPGREPSGFAFADPDHVLSILNASGWAEGAPEAVAFDYVAAEGEDAVERALSFMAELGPASRVLQSLRETERGAASERMRRVIERQFDGSAVIFPAAAWIWRAAAP